MKNISLYLLIAALLGACASDPTKTQTAAQVEDRTQGQKPPVTPSTTDTRPLIPPVSTVSPLKDPNNILSQRSVFYDLDSFDVKTEYKAMVDAHGNYLASNPNAKVFLQGNADERGSREYNLALGQKRADGVRKILSLLGAKENQVEAVSFGEEKPRAECHDESCWSQNRRTDFVYQGE
jgi:peptidoglycan-associated lipoprotein